MEITTEILQKIRASKPNTPEVLRDKYIELTKQGYTDSYRVFCSKLSRLSNLDRRKIEMENSIERNQKFQAFSEYSSHYDLILKPKTRFARFLLKLFRNQFLIINQK